MTELQKDRVQEVAFLLYACLGLESHVILKELTCKREKVQNPVMVELKTEEDLCCSVDYILKTYGPDSLEGRMVGIMVGSTETILYTMSVYFMAVGIKKTRYTLSGALLSNLAGVAASVFVTYWIFY